MYGYVNNDPINFIDPNGESATGYAGGMINAIIAQIKDGNVQGRSFNQAERELYTREITFDESNFRSFQCPIPSESRRDTPKVRLVPYTPMKGYGPKQWSMPGV